MPRVKEFDHDTALQQALAVFWTKGYEGASIADLTGAMGLSRSSLYESFGDKQDLFLASIRAYIERMTATRRAMLGNAASAREGIRAYLFAALGFLFDKSHPEGCFFTNTMTALGTLDNEVRDLLRQSTAAQEKDFRHCLERGQARGEIDAGRDIALVAGYLTSLLRGLTVMVRIERDRKKLEAIVELGLEAI